MKVAETNTLATTNKSIAKQVKDLVTKLTSLKRELDAFAEKTENIEEEFKESSDLEKRGMWQWHEWHETTTCLNPSYSCGLVYRSIMLLSGDDYRSHLEEVLADKLPTAQSHLLGYYNVISGLVNDRCSAPATALDLADKLVEIIMDVDDILS